MSRVRWMFVFCVSAALTAGCKTVNTTERAEPTAHPHPVADRRVITDRDVGAFAMILGVRETIVPGDLVKVQVDVYNSRSTTEHFNYKFEWFDDQGMIVDSPMSIWQPRTIQGKETLSLTAVAPNPRARDFRLKLQESKGN